jgi:hypothetical protein
MIPDEHELNTTCKSILWHQFAASIDMLENVLRACPNQLWGAPVWGEHVERPELTEFWYVAYHTLFWLDLYLFGSVEGFFPPAPFTLEELDPAGLLPPRQYTRDELLAYLEHNRQKCRITIVNLNDEKADQLCKFPWGELTFAELLLDNMRHVQEHAAQLNLFLGQKTGLEARWVARTKK